MKIIAGLGNIGRDYLLTRHNMGFMAIDHILHCYPPLYNKNKFNASLYKVSISGNSILLIKPNTFVNNSGLAIKSALNFFKIKSSELVVIYDDIDMKFLNIKIKVDGGSGGHNGIKSLMNHLKNDFVRIKIGIGRPHENRSVVDHVLSKFSVEQLSKIDEFLAKFAKNLPLLLEEKTTTSQNKAIFLQKIKE